jgi:nickel/cobalt transporter (NicO) family protein
MSHHHHSDPDHLHPHDHPHNDAGNELTFEKKLGTILEHWIRHNESHARAYQEWAQKASMRLMHDVHARIEEAVVLTMEANRKFEEALQRVRERA